MTRALLQTLGMATFVLCLSNSWWWRNEADVFTMWGLSIMAFVGGVLVGICARP